MVTVVIPHIESRVVVEVDIVWAFVFVTAMAINAQVRNK
jgi:hypothetical protein